MTEPVPVISRRAVHLSLVALATSGLVLLLVCLYWNRIALGGRLGDAPEWVHDLARPIAAIHEATLGPISADPAGKPQTHRIVQTVAGWALACGAYFVGVWLVLRVPAAREQVCWDVVLAVAIVCRVVLIFSPPILETDPSRYLWDGAVLSSGVNPYRYAPLEVVRWSAGGGRQDGIVRDGGPFAPLIPPPKPPSGSPSELARVARSAAELDLLVELSRDSRLDRQFAFINHPHVPTCYPPLAEHLFSLVHRIAPGEPMALKALIVALDLGIVALVSVLLAALGRPRAFGLIYAWCPMVLKEYAQTGHYDVVATFCLLASLVLLIRGWRGLAGVYLGLAALGKVYPLVVLPALLVAYGKRGAALCLATIALFWAPFLSIGAAAFSGLSTYSTEWVRNASIFAVVERLLGCLNRSPEGNESFLAARVVVGAALLVALVLIWRRSGSGPRHLVEQGYFAVSALFLLSPVANPWYCGWIMPFAAVLGRVSWVVLSATMATAYAYWLTARHALRLPGGFTIDARLLEYVPFFVLLFLEERRARDDDG